MEPKGETIDDLIESVVVMFEDWGWDVRIPPIPIHDRENIFSVTITINQVENKDE